MLLALDTSLDATSAAVGSPDGRMRAARREIGAARQAERLMPLIDDVLREGGIAPRALTKIGVTVGPGSFTGLRIALAAARALGAALSIPVIGVTTTKLLQAGAPKGEPTLVALDARHGRLYVELFDGGGESLGPPVVAQEVAQLGVSLGAPPGAPPGAGVRTAQRCIAVTGSGTTLACEWLHALGLAARACEGPSDPDARHLLPLIAPLDAPVGEMPTALYLRPPDVTAPRARET